MALPARYAPDSGRPATGMTHEATLHVVHHHEHRRGATQHVTPAARTALLAIPLWAVLVAVTGGALLDAAPADILAVTVAALLAYAVGIAALLRRGSR